MNYNGPQPSPPPPPQRSIDDYFATEQELVAARARIAELETERDAWRGEAAKHIKAAADLSERVAKLKALVDYADDATAKHWSNCCVLARQKQELEASNRSLRAIVDRLPKYADTGEPIIGGDTGYIRSDAFSWLGDDPVGTRFDDDDNEVAIIAKVTVWNRAKDHYCLTIEGHEESDYGDGPIYSTEAAALAAKEANR